MAANTKGLEDITAGETSICTVGKEGKDLKYRGYSIKEMAGAARFEEVAYLLLEGRPPNQAELDGFLDELKSRKELPKQVTDVLKTLPADTHPMDVLRTGVSLLGCFCPDDPDNPMDAVYRLMATLPAMVLVWHHEHKGTEYKEPAESGIAGRFLEGLYGTAPTDIQREGMETSLILYAEHEFNASTFAARVTTATLSDMYSAVCTAVGTLKGPLHGGANEAAMEMMLPLNDEAEAEAFIDDALKNKVKIMGFGHRVYKKNDPRSDIIQEHARQLCERKNDFKYYNVAVTIDKKIRAEKGLFPNADFYSAIFYHMLDIPIPLYTPIFVFSRIAGWAAHILEQRADNRLIRPTADYIGPEPQTWVPIAER